MTRTQGWCITVSASATLGCACALLLSVRATVVTVPQMVAVAQAGALARVDRLQATLDSLPSQIVPPALALLDRQASGTRADAVARLDATLSVADRRIGDTLARVDAAVGIVDQLEADARPALSNTAALVKDAQDSFDDLYPDLKGSVASATVAITSVAYASEAVRDAAPAVAASVVSVSKSVDGIGKSADGIAADVKREADSITAPKKWYAKLLGPVYTVGRLVAAFL